METDETARKTLSIKISSQRSYFIIILVCSLASYAVLRRTNNCSLAATWTACKTFHLPDYLKKLSNSSVLEHFTDVNSIPGTTGPGIPTVIWLALSTKYGGVNTNASSSYGAAAAVSRLEAECGWDPGSSNFVHPECIKQFSFTRKPRSFDISDYYHEIDIVIPTIRDLDFLEHWKPFFRHFHLIIIQDGDPNKVLEIPKWADFELYNRWDIDYILGKNQSWIISSHDASIRNFGFLVSNKTFVYTIDDDCFPARTPDGVKIDALLRHIQNLITNSTPYFFNTLYDPYREGSDFVRGYPFSLRRGVPTAISHGIWLNAPDYDAPTQLLKVDERNTHFVDMTITVPAGVLYPMCSMNVAFNRKLIGVAFMQGLMGSNMPWGRYDDMFAGWASKVVADHLGLGVKTGAPYIEHHKASNPFVNLKKEYMGFFWQEDIIAFFQQVRFPPSIKTPESCYLELAEMIRSQLTHLHPYFNRLAEAMEIWVHLWKQAQKGTLRFHPIRQSWSNISTNPYAVFTICRNEKGYLPIWLGYYRRHFADKDIYILDNDSNDGSTSNLTVNVNRVSSEKYFDHMWLVETVQNMARNLFERGYRYILFCEVDEMVVPDPIKYPLGIIDYIKKAKEEVIRVSSYRIVHNTTLEPKLDLNKPIMQQRRYWVKDNDYNKPLLISREIHWVAGFHECQEKGVLDPDLIMIHLQRMDLDFYMKRATWKSNQTFKAEDVQRNWGTQHQLRGAKAEEWFFSTGGNVFEIPKQFRSVPLF
ncbi:unnamed protein product [Adineta steineri]|uniref:Uncharacterized protein n=1 Tax=Adineta steineri TaxID=433720 RepID=A0A815M2D7_9BILA|nr:unnamed protein product [Adineta steineri]CAF1414632.1 unnamed protein product [Adineta steineri]